MKAREGQRRLPGASSPLRGVAEVRGRRGASYWELMPPEPPLALAKARGYSAMVAMLEKAGAR